MFRVSPRPNREITEVPIARRSGLIRPLLSKGPPRLLKPAIRFGLSDSNWSGRKLSLAQIVRPFLRSASPLTVFRFGPPFPAANTTSRSGALAIRLSAAAANALYDVDPLPQLLLLTTNHARLPPSIPALCVTMFEGSNHGLPHVACVSPVIMVVM